MARELVRKQHQKIIEDHIDLHSELYIGTSQAIHSKPQIGNQEFFASDTLTGILQHKGFEVTRNIAGHETGFIAKKTSSKEGPTIAFLAEYDALPGLGHASAIISSAQRVLQQAFPLPKCWRKQAER